MSSLRDKIAQHIRGRGAIPFSEYMALALYSAEGYYSSHATPPDYYTNVNVSNLFSQALANYFLSLNSDGVIDWVELGPGSGQLAQGLFQFLEKEAPQVLPRIRYWAFETSALRRESLLEKLERWKDQVTIHPPEMLEQLSFSGIVFSNEFFDALPFERVRNCDGKIEMAFVEENLNEIWRPADSKILQYCDWIGCKVPQGVEGEIQILARDWMYKITQALQRGYIFTIDYGHKVEELWSTLRACGTAQVYEKHQAHARFYENPGAVDITAHVNFTALMRAGEEHHFRTEFYQTQGNFLAQNALEFLLKQTSGVFDPIAQLKNKAAIQSLIHPEGMGGSFKILLQSKGV